MFGLKMRYLVMMVIIAIISCTAIGVLTYTYVSAVSG